MTWFKKMGLGLVAIVAIIGSLIGFSALINVAEAGGGGLIVSLPTVSAQIGGPDIHIPITADNGSVDGVEVTVKYDPTLLSPVDANSGLTGIQVTLGDCGLPTVLLNYIDSTKGEVHLALGRSFSPNQPVQLNNCTLGTAIFKPIAVGVSSLQFMSRTEAASLGYLIPINPQDGQVTITGDLTYIVRVDWNTYVTGVNWAVQSKDGPATVERGTWYQDGSYAGEIIQLTTDPFTAQFPVASAHTPWAFATHLGPVELATLWDVNVCPKGPEVFATQTGVTVISAPGTTGWHMKDAEGNVVPLNQHMVGTKINLAVFTANNQLCSLVGYEHK